MLGDLFSSTSEYVKSKLVNPFLGTLIFVWIIRNFVFVYALFNFAEGVTLTQKANYLRAYFQKQDCLKEFAINLTISLILMILSYFFQLISKALANIYKALLNKLNEKTDKGSVVAREDYDKLRMQYNAAKEERDRLRTEANLHDEAVKDYQNRISKVIEEREISTKELSNAKSQVESLQNAIQKFEQRVPKIEQILENNSTNISTENKTKFPNYNLDLIDPSEMPAAIKQPDIQIKLENNLKAFKRSKFLKSFPKTKRDYLQKFDITEVNDYVAKCILIGQAENKASYYPYDMFEMYESLGLLLINGRIVDDEVKLADVSKTEVGEELHQFFIS